MDFCVCACVSTKVRFAQIRNPIQLLNPVKLDGKHIWQEIERTADSEFWERSKKARKEHFKFSNPSNFWDFPYCKLWLIWNVKQLFVRSIIQCYYEEQLWWIPSGISSFSLFHFHYSNWSTVQRERQLQITAALSFLYRNLPTAEWR